MQAVVVVLQKARNFLAGPNKILTIVPSCTASVSNGGNCQFIRRNTCLVEYGPQVMGTFSETGDFVRRTEVYESMDSRRLGGKALEYTRVVSIPDNERSELRP